MSKSMNKGSTKCFCAIDFGSEVTRVAYSVQTSSSSTIDEPKLFTNWPEQGHTKSPYLPSIVCYPKNGRSLWGFGAAKDLKAMKVYPAIMLKEYETDLSKLGFCSKKDHRQAPFNSATVLTDFFEPLFKFLLSSTSDPAEGLEKLTILSTTDEVIQTLTARSNIYFDITITFPISWTEISISKLRRCWLSVLAGRYGRLRFVQSDIASLSHTNLALKDEGLFIFLDLGSITVRSTAYEITDLELEERRMGNSTNFISHATGMALSKPLRASESLCGAAFLNHTFGLMIQKKIQKLVDGPCPPPHHILERYKAEMMKAFNDFIKRDFGNSISAKYSLRLPPGIPDDSVENIQDSVLTLTRKDVLSIFNPVVDAIAEFLRGEIKAIQDNFTKRSEIKSKLIAIYVSGGFSDSPFLRSRISDLPAVKNIEVNFLSNGSTAACIGAIKRLSDKSIVKRELARHTLALAVDQPWKDGFPDHHRYWDTLECVYYARNFLKRLTTQGLQYHHNDEAATIFIRKNVELTHNLIFEDFIYRIPASSSQSEFVNNDTELFAKIVTHIPEWMRSEFKQCTRPLIYGGGYLQVDYFLRIRFDPDIYTRCLIGNHKLFNEVVYVNDNVMLPDKSIDSPPNAT